MKREKRMTLAERMATPLTERDDDMGFQAFSDVTGVPVGTTRKAACPTCPFRLPNARVDTAYAPSETLDNVWSGKGRRPGAGVQDGSPMLCHCAVDARRSDWLYATPEYRQCVGALVVQQREAIRYHEHGESAVTETAIGRIVRQMFQPARSLGYWSLNSFRKMRRDDVLAAAHPAIGDPAIGHPDLDGPRPGEFE